MDDTLAIELDLWLRCQNRWVSGREICERFGINERRLRFDQGKPGLLSYNAVSCSQRGFKHVRMASDAEFIECDTKDRKHNVSRYLVLRARRNTRRNEFTGRRPDMIERHSGQMVFL
jgi:hypothetical protein